MHEGKIDVAIACGTNSEAYAEFLVWSINSTALNPDRFRYIFGINHDSVDDNRLKKIGSVADVTVIDARSGLGYCSDSHAISLDIIFEHVSSDISMVCDVDVAFISKNWDEAYLSLIHNECVAVGPEYARTYHLRGGHHKHLGFPNLLATMMITKHFKDNKISFKPADDITLTEIDAHLYGLPVGTRVRRDTGWELSPKLRQHGYTGVAMKMLSFGDQESVLLVNENVNGNEFHLDGIPVLTHMGRSSIRQFGVHPAAILWEKRVREWITKCQKN